MMETQTQLLSHAIPNQGASAVATRELWKNQRFDSQAHKMLEMFKAYNWIPTDTLAACFKQYNARILELRGGKLDGTNYMIKSEVRNGNWGFKFEGKY